ncbi:MAG: hypothetical protein IJG82_08135 [Atopobiaceae bacterium]|nr:hypothetical protein [Atopobiaceae bacterium]
MDTTPHDLHEAALVAQPARDLEHLGLGAGELLVAALRSPVKSGRGGVAAACAPPPS